MKKFFTTLFYYIVGKHSKKEGTTNLVIFTIHENMSRKEFTQTLANCFVGVPRPEKQCRRINIFDTPNTDLVKLRWNKAQNSVSFITLHDVHTHGIALLQLNPGVIKFLKNAYESISTSEFKKYVGEHQLNLTVTKSSFPLCC